jgi:hypothetical protein
MNWANPSGLSQSIHTTTYLQPARPWQHVKECVKTPMVDTKVQPTAARTKIHCRKQHTIEKPTEKKKLT